MPSSDLERQSFRLAAENPCTVHDSAYLALALGVRGYLIIADERVAHALAALSGEVAGFVLVSHSLSLSRSTV